MTLDLWLAARTYLLAHGYLQGDITDFHYASMDGAASVIGRFAISPAWMYCRRKAMPRPPGWNWYTPSGAAARICAISAAKSVWSRRV